MTRQAALLLALGALAAAAAVVSFGSWILLRRGGRPEGSPASPTEPWPDDLDAPPAGGTRE
jgi:hypothetical protein